MKNSFLWVVGICLACGSKTPHGGVPPTVPKDTYEDIPLKDTILFDPIPTYNPPKKIPIPNWVSTPRRFNDGFYKHLHGTIEDEPITMDLTVTSRQDLPRNLVIGGYTYEKSSGLHLFEGTTVGDSLIFIERENIREVARFALKSSQSLLEGTRIDFKTQKVSRIRLSESDSKIKFQYWGARDSIDIIQQGNKILKGIVPNLKPFYMYFDRHYLIPQSNDSELDTSILGNLSRLFPEEPLPPASKRFFDTLRQKVFKEHLEVFIEHHPKGITDPEGLGNYFIDSQRNKRTYFILYNDDHFLTIAYIYPLRKFLGYRRTRVLSYDVQKRKMIHLNDFLRESQSEILEKIIQKDINQAFANTKSPKNIGGEVDKMGYWQWVNIDGDGDFGITPKGLFIAGFKKYYGDMPWTIDLRQVKSVLKPDFYQELQK